MNSLLPPGRFDPFSWTRRPSTLSVFSKPFAPNLVYQFHYYCWDNPENLRDINSYLDYRKKWNAPVWVGETGESTAGQTRDERRAKTSPRELPKQPY